jgi:hypothetical protein
LLDRLTASFHGVNTTTVVNYWLPFVVERKYAVALVLNYCS